MDHVLTSEITSDVQFTKPVKMGPDFISVFIQKSGGT